MLQIFPHNANLYSLWLARAMQDDNVWPYLTGEPSLDTRIDVSDEFKQVHFLSESGNAFASLFFNRRKYLARAKLFVVCLDGNINAKRRDATAAYKFLCRDDHIFKRFHILYVDFAVHETNLDAIRFYTRRAKPWGIEPHGLFDRRLQSWVNAYHYRLDSSDIAKFAPGFRK